jgi:hypothetical protein
MKKLINLFDLYGKHISLYTKSSSKATTCVGFIFTIISLLLLGFIIYLECYEIFIRENPNVISYRQSLNKNNSTLSISNDTLNFYININIDFEMDNYLSHLSIVSYIEYHRRDLTSVSINYEYCNNEDKTKFQKYDEKFEFSNVGINLCPRINYTKTENLSFSGFTLIFNIWECSKDNSDCTVDEELNRNIREKKYNIDAKLNFIDNQIDFTNYEKPFWFQSNYFYSFSYVNVSKVIELDGSEINSQSIFSFSKPTIQSQFGIQRDYISPKHEKNYISFILGFNSHDMYIYKRTYKTFNSAFATSFALFKLFNQIISIILSPIYTYYINTIIINNNFDYELFNLNDETKSINKHVNRKKEISLELMNVKTKKLTTFLALKNVSLLRYILCKRRNKTKTFYDQAKYVIYKHLSVENLFSYLSDYVRLKKTLSNKDSDIEFTLNPENNKLILNNQEKVDKEKLRMDELTNNTYLFNKYRENK